MDYQSVYFGHTLLNMTKQYLEDQKLQEEINKERKIKHALEKFHKEDKVVYPLLTQNKEDKSYLASSKLLIPCYNEKMNFRHNRNAYCKWSLIFQNHNKRYLQDVFFEQTKDLRLSQTQTRYKQTANRNIFSRFHVLRR